MKKQEYLMLGHSFRPGKDNIAGWFMSEKFDGRRCFWDGGLSRGMPASVVPYANTVKDYRLKQSPIATGMWSRTGKVVHAPDWWLDELPMVPLDGELFSGRKQFQDLSKIVAKHTGGDDWNQVTLRAFDSPPFLKMFAQRTVTVRDYDFKIPNCMAWYQRHINSDIQIASDRWTFEMVQMWLKKKDLGAVASLIRQEQLPFCHLDAVKQVERRLEDLLKVGGEGVMLRKHSSLWVTERCRTLLKYKPWLDDEAVIIGFTTGRETEKGSRLLGKIGALIVDYKEKRLELSGLTDEEREFKHSWDSAWALLNPGKDAPNNAEGKHFKIGQTITFKYRELSDDGVPKEARYWRKRDAE
jgi:DNA ligase-1